jgi:methylase of polypeptide subunit release factors
MAQLDKLFAYGKSASYAAYRPNYPIEILDYVLGATPGRATCLDIATGTGQIAVPMANHFTEVIGIDTSET